MIFLITLSCGHCGKEFKRYESQVRHSISFCSNSCYGASKKGVSKPSTGYHLKGKKPHNFKENIVSCSVCNKQFHRSPGNIKGHVIYCSRECRTKQVIHSCLYCQKEFSVRQYRTDVKYCSRSCLAKAFLPKFEEFRFKPSGQSTRPTRKYRKIMEEHLGRKLTKDEHVHHIDGNPENNELSNLMVVSNAEHGRIHASIRMKKETLS